MTQNRLLLVLLCSFLSLAARAQGENNIWAFGINAGIDFSSGEPVFFFSRMNTAEGCASISDAAGNLLFYSSGDHVWDRQHNEMPNSPGLIGNSGGWAGRGSSTQGVAIVPVIGDSNLYYHFVIDPRETLTPVYPGYLRYSLIDMRLNNGLGDVVPSAKNIILDDSTSEKMAVIQGDGCFFWLLVHKYGSPEFRAFKISAAGIDTIPVTSAVSCHDPSLLEKESYGGGEMKATEDGTLLALVNGLPEGTELYDFNNSTGRVSNPRQIPLPPRSAYNYGISFSPRGSKLYIGPVLSISGTMRNRLVQYDLSLLPDMNAVRNSETGVGDTSNYGAGMRIGPDGKVYIVALNANIVSRVNKPELRGNACHVEQLTFTVPDTVYFMAGYGLPVPSRTRPFRSSFTDTVLCSGSSLTLQAPPGYERYTWHDGRQEPARVVDVTSLSWVRSEDQCATRIDSFSVKVRRCSGCLVFPTAFSPNGDGRNDLFRPVSECPVQHYHLAVYNRWGQRVFSSFQPGQGWDGTFQGRKAEIGTYYYSCFVEMSGDSGSEKLKGEINLLR